MANVRKGLLSKTIGWAKHKRNIYGSQWRRERNAVKRFIRKEVGR